MNSEVKKSISGTALKHVVLSYIPRQFLKDVDLSKLGFENSKLIKDGGVDILQKLLDKSNDELRMYGSGKELAEDLHVYRSFPSSHKKLGIDITEEYNASPIPYSNLKKEMFLCKQDLFISLQESVFSMLPKNTHQLTRSMLMIFLKTNEEKVSNCFEFVRYKQKVIEQIMYEISQTMVKIKDIKNSLKSQQSSFKEIFAEMELFLTNWTDQQYEHVQKALQIHFKIYPLEKFHEMYSEVFSTTKILIEMLRNIINNRPEMYLPYSETNSQNMTAVVRLFEDGNQKFVMKSELYKAINLTNPNQKPLKYEDEKGYLCAMEMDEVHENYGNQSKRIEFVHAVILKADHMAVPIMTPSGDHCILAIDAFSHILRRLVQVTRIFQKIKSGWDLIVDYIKLITKEIKFDMKCRYFVTFDVIEKLEEKTYEFFKSFENKPTKSIRDVRKVGFTVNYLKNELTRLGITDVFHDIVNNADVAHGMITAKKIGRYLRTCDLFEAIEDCQLHCFREQFPGMDHFLHNQKSCKTMPYYQCEYCLSNTESTSFSGTIWNEYSFSDGKLEQFDDFNGEQFPHWYLKFPKGNRLIANSSFPSYWQETNEFKYFILDGSDIQWFQNNANNKTGYEGVLINLETFMQKCPNKDIYIRSFTTIPSKTAESKEKKRVFTDEVLDIIPILLKQQGKSITGVNKKLIEYRTKWKCEQTIVSTTINLTEFEHVLEEFNVNKSLITIVPDPYFLLSESHMPTHNGCPSVLVENSKRDWVMDSSQAVFHVFQSVVCNVDWTEEYCKIHKNCMNTLKKDVINDMNEYARMKEGSYILSEHVDDCIEKHKNQCTYRHQSTFMTPLMNLESYRFDEKRLMSVINSECDFFNVPLDYRPVIQTKENYIPVWLARYLFLKVWIQMFFDENDVELVKLIANALRFKFEEFLKRENQKSIVDIPGEVSEKLSKPNEELTEGRLSEEAVAENSIGLLKSIEKVESTAKSSEKAMENIKIMLKEDVTEDSNETKKGDVHEYSCMFQVDPEKIVNEPEYFKSKVRHFVDTMIPKEFHNSPVSLELELRPSTEVDKMTGKSIESAQKNVPIMDKETENAPIDREISKKHQNIVDTSTDESIGKVEKTKEMDEVITEDSNEIRERDELKNNSTLKISSEKTENLSKRSKITIKLADTNPKVFYNKQQIESFQKNGPVKHKTTEHALIEREINEKKKSILGISPEESMENIEIILKEGITEDSNKIIQRNELKDDSTLNINSEKTGNESKCCVACLKTNSILDEVKKELDTTRNERHMMEKKVESLEKNLTTTTTILQETKQELENSKEKTTIAEKKSERIRENMEEKLKKKNEEIEKIKKQLSEFSNCSKENETLKARIIKITENETKLKETNKKITDSRSQVSRKVIELESQLKSEKQTDREREQEVKRLKEKAEIDQKNISKLTDSRNQLLKRVHHLEAQLKRAKQESEDLKKDVIQQQKTIEEDAVMMENFEKETSENKETINLLTDVQFQLSDRVRQLESQLESENQQNIESFEADQMGNEMQSNVEKDVSDNKKAIAELRESYMRLSIRNEEQDRMYKILLDKLASGSTTTSSNRTETSTAVVMENSDGYRLQLVRLQKIKDSFRQNIQLKQAKSMVEKLISLTDRSEIHQLANYELQQFELNMRNYMQAVEINIQKIKKTQNCDDMSPLSEIPKLSERFMTKYWDEIEKQPSTSSEISSELADPECLICLSNVESVQKTLKCEHCRRRFHLNCASEWLKTKMICPACNRALLNPEEFPSLS